MSAMDSFNSADSSRPAVISWRFSAAPRKRSKIREITAAIDPFLQLPDAMSAEDRSLLHSYLLHVPSRVYGTEIASIFNPVRDVSFPISLSSDLTMRWMLIAADGLFTNDRTGGDTQVSLMRRKGQAYRRLNDAICENNGASRLMDPFASNTHLQGFEAALGARGGLEASLKTASKRALRMSHVMPNVVCTPLKSDGEPDDARQLYRFVDRLRAVMGASGFAPDERRVTRFMDEAPSYLSLFLITMTFWMVTKSGPSAELCVDRLIAVLEGSSAFDLNTGAPLLTEQGFMFVVLKAVQDFQQDYGLSMEYEVWPVVSAIDALKAFRALPSPRARKKARCILFYLLLGQVLYPGSVLEDTFEILPKTAKVHRK
ncbi:hypothetical protein BJX68DRAFT_277777 [Aspergillus pseudodeflectus]|uniref:Uncharacterized protein n=1 Tax=Aspergillus pseudodeflectus TaxID=176178 RepID=A0ABR4JXU0_9EURO